MDQQQRLLREVERYPPYKPAPRPMTPSDVSTDEEERERREKERRAKMKASFKHSSRFRSMTQAQLGEEEEQEGAVVGFFKEMFSTEDTDGTLNLLFQNFFKLFSNLKL